METSVEQYRRLNSITEEPFAEINPVKTFPTNQDYSNGNMLRFFAQQKNNPEKVVEVLSANSSGILYNVESTYWKLTGVLEDDISEEGNTLEFGVLGTNKRMIADLKKKIPVIDQLLVDPLEHTVHSSFVSDKIKKMFG